MIYLFDNLNWMLFNIFLSFIPIVLVVMIRKKFNIFFHLALFFLWFIFLPNTIYLLTDLEYLPYQIFRSSFYEQALLFIEYGLLASFGVFSYLYSLEPIELVIKKFKVKKGRENLFYIILHLLVAFGVVMGKVQRTHSWYIFTDPQRVLKDVIATISAQNLLYWVLFCAVVINGFFFLFKKYFPVFAMSKKKKK